MSEAVKKGFWVMEKEVFVASEFAPLRRVVLAQSEFGIPNSISAEEGRFLVDDVNKVDEHTFGKDFSVAFPQEQKLWEIERESLRLVLEKYGVEVLRPRLLEDAEKQDFDNGYSNFFVRDPFFTIGAQLIEGSLRLKHRRKEVFPVRDILIANSEEGYYVATPQPNAVDKTVGPFLEGGDVLVLGKQIFVGASGLASDKLGYSWLKAYLTHFGYSVEFVPLHPDILHLDCALSLVNEELIIVCEEALLEGIPATLKHCAKINVSLDDASRLATNGLPINETTYIMDPAFEWIGNELEKRGITIEYIDFAISRSLGGSFRCSTQPLLRK
jgi:N-dimethylarginine dimethylaminohydrolase